MSKIHSTAIIDKNCVIGKNVTVGAHTVIEGNVKIDDVKDIIEINEESIPAVNTVSLMQFKSFLRDSIYFKVVTNRSQKICGFLLVLPSGLEYDSLNYKWFSSRYEKFAYIDRIAISKNWRNKGMGKSLYTDLENTLKDYNLIACEFFSPRSSTVTLSGINSPKFFTISF